MDSQLVVNRLRQDALYARYRALYIARMSAQQYQFDEDMLSKCIDRVTQEMLQNTIEHNELLKKMAKL